MYKCYGLGLMITELLNSSITAAEPVTFGLWVKKYILYSRRQAWLFLYL